MGSSPLPSKRESSLSSLVILIVLLVFGIALVSSLWWRSNSDSWSIASAGIGASVLAAVIFDGVPRIVQWIEDSGLNKKAKEFFGKDFVNGSGEIIVLQWRGQTIDEFQFPLVDARDMDGVIDVANELINRFGHPIKTEADNSPTIDHGKSFITIGLSENKYAKLIADRDVDKNITWRSRKKRDFCHISYKDESGNWIDLNAGPDQDFGIIVRVVPRSHPNRVWILCGGAGSWGTSGASWYLAAHWDVLYREWKARNGLQPGKISIALIRTCPDQLRSAVIYKNNIKVVDESFD